MRKLLLVVVAMLFLGACGNSVGLDEINSHISKMKEHAETAGSNPEQYMEDIKEFNLILENVNDDLKRYAETQIEANNMRLEGLKNNNTELISDSTWIQAKALQILDELKEP